MTNLEKARQLRADTQTHFNCAQAVIVSFAQEIGLTEQQAFDLGAHFGSGMSHGSTCGAVTGALMVLGMAGKDKQSAAAILNQVKEGHGALDCPTLLRTSLERGEVRKNHCDGLVFEMVEALSKLLEKQ